MNRAIKYRMYPNKDQADLFSKTFGCCRKIWNLMLADREAAYKRDGSVFLPRPAMYKDRYPFLREVDSLALANVQLQLQQAYKNYFTVKGVRHPKFKSKKRSRNSYTTNNQKGTVAVLSNAVRLPKIGLVSAKIHRLQEEGWKLKSATVSMEKDGTYWCSILFEYDSAASAISNPVEKCVGLDYKSDGLYVSSDGVICGSPKYYRRSQERLAKAQRRLRHKDKNSSNYRKACLKIAKVHRHISNQRKDFLHKKSAEIANRYDMVCVESLNMRAMSNKGFGNGKATMDNGYGMFLNMLAYKLQDRGGFLVKVDKWFPSSQMCSCCGTIHHEVKDLRIRRWTCPDCGKDHDRDLNAAINIRSEGIKKFLAG